MPVLTSIVGASPRAPWEETPFDEIIQSAEARSMAESVRRDRTSAAAVRAHSAQVDAGLAAVVADARLPNWDGYGGRPAHAGSVTRARQLLELLADYAVPDFDIDPQGRVVLDWWIDREWSLSVLVGAGADASLIYAGSFGRGATARGRESFTGASLPGEISGAITRLYRQSA